MKTIFERKALIYLTLTILFLVGLSIIYQMFFVKSKMRDVHRAVSNSFLVNQQLSLSDVIVDTRLEHDFVMYLFIGYDEGCYFGLENTGLNERLNDFVKFKNTKISKKENDSIVQFINDYDTMTIIFNVNQQNKVLHNWKVK